MMESMFYVMIYLLLKAMEKLLVVARELGLSKKFLLELMKKVHQESHINSTLILVHMGEYLTVDLVLEWTEFAHGLVVLSTSVK